MTDAKSLSEQAVGYGLAAGTWGAAVAGFPFALGVGVAMYIALHHTKSGRRYRDLMDALAADEAADEPAQETDGEAVA